MQLVTHARLLFPMVIGLGASFSGIISYTTLHYQHSPSRQLTLILPTPKPTFHRGTARLAWVLLLLPVCTIRMV